MSFLKKKEKAADTKKFNGISIAKTPNKLVRYIRTNQVIEAAQKYDYRLHGGQGEASGDSLSFYKNGLLQIEDGKYKLYDSALYQLLNYLRIPVKFARRVPSDLLIDIINRMFAESYDISFKYKQLTKGVIFAILPSSVNLPASYNILQPLLAKDKMKARDTHFLFATESGWTTMTLLGFGKLKNSDDNTGYAACEILYSDAADCKPTVSGMVVSAKGHAIIPSLSYQVDTNNSGTRLLQNIETLIVRVKQEIDPYVKKFNDMKKVKITKDLDKILQNKASKVLPVKINSLSGGTMDGIFKELTRAKKGGDWTLWERRNFAQYVGRSLEYII